MTAQADSPAQRRLALLIATSDYNDPALQRLRAPGHDAIDLKGVLRAPQIGGFAVQTLVNRRFGELLRAIEKFCRDRRPDDELLIYLSCHGLLDDSGRLYYAATDTRQQLTASTAVPATWLTDRLDSCRARSQIVILDCCHSGAFAPGSKGQADLALEQRFEPKGRGRIVLTASRRTEYSFEGDHPSGSGVRSVFTRAIVDGLRTGDADRDKDGRITVTDIYHYVYQKVQAAEPRQTPELWTYGAEGDILLAYSVRGAVIEPAALPEDLLVTLQSPLARVRETAVADLAELLDAARPALALSARAALQKISEADSPRIAAIADAALTAAQGTAARRVGQELADRGQRERVRQEAQEAARQQAKKHAPPEALPDVEKTAGRRPRPRLLATALACVILMAAVVITLVLTLPGAPPGPSHAAANTRAGTPPLSGLLKGTLAAKLATSASQDATFAVFGPGGVTLADADANGSVYLWDIAAKRNTATFTDPTDNSVNSVAFGQRGTTLAVGDNNGNIYLWDPATGKTTETFLDPSSQGVNSVAFGPGTALAAADGNGHIYLWDTATGKTTKAFLDPSSGGVNSVAFGPGTALAAADGNGHIYLWDTATGKTTETFLDPSSDGVKSVAFGPGTALAAGDADGSVYLWDTATRKTTATLPDPAGKGVKSVAFGPGGTTLAAADLNGGIYLWRLTGHDP
jgi:caspase domain-containing protein/WD40 domain-containing protein